MTKPEPRKSEDSAPAPSFLQMVGSVLAAFFGVQSRANRERDFTRGKALHFIAIGAMMTALLVLAVVALVRLILSQAGA